MKINYFQRFYAASFHATLSAAEYKPEYIS